MLTYELGSERKKGIRRKSVRKRSSRGRGWESGGSRVNHCRHARDHSSSQNKNRTALKAGGGKKQGGLGIASQRGEGARLHHERGIR